MSYCVYGHYGDDGICFYVGIGDTKRPYDFWGRSKFWKSYTKKHCALGKPVVKIWITGLSWEKACENEKMWINLYGRRDLGTGCLVNMTDGGEGSVGCYPSESTRQKLSAAKKGKTFSNDHRQKLSAAKRNPCRGYYFNKKVQKYQAQIKILGKSHNLGYFATENEASEAYQNALSNLNNRS